jgi:hypothetical protein
VVEWLIPLFHIREVPGSSLGNRLRQGWANYGPRAKYGPLRGSMRPAEGLENAKKNKVSKNICENIIKPSKIKAK